MPCDLNSTIVGFVSGSAFGAIASAIITQRAIGSREARDRKNAFRGHLGRWLGALQQVSDGDVARVHDEFAPHIMGYYAHGRADIFRKGKFKALCEDLSTTKKDSSDYRSEITQKIEALIAFV